MTHAAKLDFSMFNCLIHYRKVTALLALIVLPALLQISCGNGDSSADTTTVSPPTIRAVTVSWNANRETAVNTTGGGYKVYYSTTSGFDISDAGVGVVDVPFVAPPATPTSVSLQLVSGQYYFRVVAYSGLVAPWGSGGSTSAPSAQIALLVP
jgi:hypothetical protein